MTVQIQFRENRFGKLVRTPGGISPEQGIAAARANLAKIAPELLGEVDSNLQRIEAAIGDPATPASSEAQGKAYYHSNVIAGLAGSCGYEELGQAAFSLCELLDRQRSSGAWNIASVQVHIRALQLLRSMNDAASPDGRKQVIEGLKKVAVKTFRDAAG